MIQNLTKIRTKKDFQLLILVYILTGFLFYGCQSKTEAIVPSQTLESDITPYATYTHTETPYQVTPKTTETEDAPLIPTTTPTPFYYQVIENDTFTSIAYKHNVKLRDLISANPQIDPNFLTIGITITIPITDNLTTAILVPTPIPLDMKSPECFQDSLGNLTCFVLVHNNQQYDIENLSASISIESDQNYTKLNAYSPLNLVPSGTFIPLIVTFPPPIPDNFIIRSKIESAIPISDDDQRYLELMFDSHTINISENSKTAFVHGDVSLADVDQKAEYIWIVGIAYDQNGKPVGYRKWESAKPLVSGETMVFDFIVYSFSPSIDKVEILTEAR